MTRLGFDPKETKKVIKYLSEHTYLPVNGIYSHFATADEGDLSYADSQLKKFNRILDICKDSGKQFGYIHCSNSGAVLNLPNSLFNTVRIGTVLTVGSLESSLAPLITSKYLVFGSSLADAT